MFLDDTDGIFFQASSMVNRKDDPRSPGKATARARAKATVDAANVPPPQTFSSMEGYSAFLKKLLDAEVARRTEYLRSIPHLNWAGLKHEHFRAMASFGIDTELGYRITGEEEEGLEIPSGDPEFFLHKASNFEDTLRGCFDVVSRMLGK